LLPTVTDANLVLGRINPENPIGREAGRKLDKDAAERAIQKTIGRPLGMSAVQAAWAILQVANHKIASSIRTLTVEQGRDPRDFSLFAYGGAGPLHAAALIEELEVARAIIPPLPGITSAMGCLMADVRHDFVVTINRLLADLEPESIYRIFDDHQKQGQQLIESEGISVKAVEAHLAADMAYDGQIHEVRTTLPSAVCDRETIKEAFLATYSAQYGVTVGEHPIRLLTLRTSVVGVREEIRFEPMGNAPDTPLKSAQISERPVYFEDGFRDCPVYLREALPRESELKGPAIIEQSDTTTVAEPNSMMHVDAAGNLIITK
jgi:N-methylhydantoinase A